MNELYNLFQGGGPISHSVTEILLQLGTALGLMILLSLVYRKLHSRKENNHIMMHTMIYIGVIMTGAIALITSNPVVAIGLFGAVSIVRFRTAVSDPIDMSYIFLCIVVGISCGLGFWTHAVVLTLFVAVVMMGVNRFRFGMAPPSQITCLFTITADKAFFSSEMLEELNKVFHEEAQMLELKTRKNKVKLKYTRRVKDLREIQQIQDMLNSLYKDDPSMELAVARA